MEDRKRKAGRKSTLTYLLIANSALGVATLATFGYMKLIYKRPPITEVSERERWKAVKDHPTPAPSPLLVVFEPVTVNIQSNPVAPKDPQNPRSNAIEGKLHYAAVGLVLETPNGSGKSKIEELRPMITDQLLSLLGRKSFQDLSSVQGRYILKGELQEFVNKSIGQPIVSQIYFTEFTVQ